MRRAAYIISLAMFVSSPLPSFAAAPTLTKARAVSTLTSPERVRPVRSAAQPELPPLVVPFDPHPFLTEFYGPAQVEEGKPSSTPGKASEEKAALEPKDSAKETR